MHILSLEEEVKLHGCNNLPEIIQVSQPMYDLKNLLAELKLHEKEYMVHLSSVKQTKKDAEDFLNSKFKLHKIPYKSRLMNTIDFLYLKYVPDIEKCLEHQTRFVIKINPFKLPIQVIKDQKFPTAVVENTVRIINDDYIKRMPISYNKIFLQTPISEITESQIVHEITHTQLSHNKEVISDYSNTELLSIFLEMLNVYESKESARLMPFHNAVRLTEAHNYIVLLDRYHQGEEVPEEYIRDASVYFPSIAKAYGLLMIYINGSPYVKKEILFNIQQIFDGNLKLEDMLSIYDITIDSSLSGPTLKKFLTR